MSKILVAAVALSITRDPMTILPRELPAHEVPVVQAVFGEDNVEIHEDRKLEPVELEAGGEAERLEAKYGGGALEKAFGANFKTGIAREMKAATVGTVDEGGSGEDGASQDLMALNKAQLLAMAAERGVTADASMNKAAIVAAIEAAAA